MVIELRQRKITVIINIVILTKKKITPFENFYS